MKRIATPFGLLGVIGLSLLAAGCASDPVPGPEWDMDAQPFGAHLGPVQSCEDVEAAVRDAAARSMKLSLYTEMMGWLEAEDSRCDHDDFAYMDGGDASAGSGGDTVSDPGDTAAPGPDAVSETNNQVKGVDEADFVKNDDGYIYMLSGTALHVVRSWPAEETSKVGSIEIEGTPKKLLVEGDRAIVYSSLPGAEEPYTDDYGDAYYGGSTECTYGYDCDFRGDGHPTQITIVDLTDREHPVAIRELRSNGSLLAARRIGDVVHTVVTMNGPSFPIEMGGVIGCDGDDVPGAEDVIAAYTARLRKNLDIIEASPIETILPSLTDSAASAGTDELAGCPSFYQGRLAAGGAFTTLVSFDVAGDVAPTTSTVVSDPGAVYASAESLYIAVPETQNEAYGWYEGYDDTPQLSVVHKFDLGEDGASSYVASGVIDGRVLNQFSMDEHEGHLRVATTTGHVPDPDVHSTLTVLGQVGSDLVAAGKVTNIAPGEDIRSVRFSGDRGFVVTFKKTDPLFVFDLADAAKPRILSELKIPGFSTYMHMMDDTHVLTIGYDADDHGDFAYFDGVLLQIFDISNPLAPSLAHKEIIGTRGSSSEALTNHLAFNYFAAKNVLALPMTVCEGGDDGSFGEQMTFSGLMVYDVTAADGFSLRGGLPFPTETASDPYGGGACSNWWSDATSMVRRSVIMDDFVYGITDTRIEVSSLAEVDRAIATVDLASPPAAP